VQGLRARGAFELTDMKWVDGKIVRLVIKSLAGGQCIIQVLNSLNTDVKLTENNGSVYKFETQAGKFYTFTNGSR
jgi:alpha-L-fucosidase 2